MLAVSGRGQGRGLLEEMAWIVMIHAVPASIITVHAFLRSRRVFVLHATDKQLSTNFFGYPHVMPSLYESIGELKRVRLGVWKIVLWSGHPFFFPVDALSDTDIANMRCEMQEFRSRANDRRSASSKR